MISSTGVFKEHRYLLVNGPVCRDQFPPLFWDAQDKPWRPLLSNLEAYTPWVILTRENDHE
jgi:hypothetical protein